MIRVEGRIIGVEQVVHLLNSKLPRVAETRMRNVIRALGLTLERKVKLEKLNGQVLHRRTGRLVRSINTRFQDQPYRSTAIVGTNLSYGRIWELTGSRAFRIVPVKKKALYWPGARHPVAAVMHPAQAPRPFLRTALAEMRPMIRTTIQRAMANLDGPSPVPEAG